jgi:hypothetical protein
MSDRILEATLPADFLDGEVLYGADVNKIITVLRSAVNFNKYDIDKAYMGQMNDYVFVYYDDMIEVEDATDDQYAIVLRGNTGGGATGDEDTVVLYQWNLATTTWDYVDDMIGIVEMWQGYKSYETRLETAESDIAGLEQAVDDIETGTQDIAYDNSSSGMTATTIKGAVDELDSEIDDIKSGTTIVAKATGDKDGNAIDTTYLKKAGGIMSGAIAMGTNKITGLADGVLDTDAINKKQLDDEVATIEASLDLKADLVGGLVPSSQLPSYVDDVIEVATYADLPVEGEAGKIYVVIADENGTGGDYSIYRWATSVYVKIYDELSASEIKTLYESNADTNAFTDALKTKLTDQYTKAEVDALLDSLKAIYGWESSALANDVASAATVNNSIWADYDMILLVATNGTNTYTTIARVADLIDGDTFTVGSGTFVIGATTSTFTYSGYTLDITGIKMDGTVHNEMRSVGSETITYREDGKISSVVADTITTTPTYDEYGNVTKITEVYALDGKTYETTFTYDKFGRISATNKVEV